MGDEGNSFLQINSGLITVVAVSIIMRFLVGISLGETPANHVWTGWIPPELHQAPLVWKSFFAAQKSTYIPFFLLFAAVMCLQVRGSRRALLSFNSLLYATTLAFAIKYDPEMGLRIFILIAPLLTAIFFGLIRQPVPERRFALLGVIVCAASINYIGLIPLGSPAPEFPGLTRLYPTEGKKPDVPLTRLRDFIYDKNTGRFYVSWGPTSGIFSVDTATGANKTIYSEDLSRFISLSPEDNTIYGASWINSDYLEFSALTQKPTRKISLQPYRLGQLFLAKRRGDDVYVDAYQPPVFARFDNKTFRPKAIRDFRAGYTKMSCGPAWFTFSPDGSLIYISVGMTDVPATFKILVLDSRSLKVMRSISLPELPLFFFYDEETGRLIVSSFYSDKIFEIDAATGRIKKIHHGVIHARMLLYDKTRKWFIEGSYYSGELAVIDRASSRRLISRRISRHIQFGHIDEQNELFYVVTTEGIYQVDMKAMRNYIDSGKSGK
ncbi:MAG: hypothetical protein WCX65_06160, partial [bacterium]